MRVSSVPKDFNPFICIINKKILMSISISMSSLKIIKYCPLTLLTMLLIITKNNNLNRLCARIAPKFLQNRLKTIVLQKMLIFVLNVTMTIIFRNQLQNITESKSSKSPKNLDIVINISRLNWNFIAVFVVKRFA